ncbi:hypothetical protein C8R45DRAFT_1186263 [Mycena sanguinolenta]|nr:hypothetical protein C8R45DRAFT_1186263 [Mycena sanguinolenta]
MILLRVSIRWQFEFSSLLFPLIAGSGIFALEPLPAMQRLFCVLLCVGRVFATLQNYTVDDTSPDIQYDTAAGAFVCNTSTCPPEVTDGLSNNSATLTNGTIFFYFTGTAVYVTLWGLVGLCSVAVDGTVFDTLNKTLANAIDAPFNVFTSGLPNVPHTLVITPTPPLTVIGFDHVIYTSGILPAKSHVGAIVGSVIGGVVLTIGALFVALLAQRQKLIMRRNQRKSVVLRAMTSARTNHKASVDDGTDDVTLA